MMVTWLLCPCARMLVVAIISRKSSFVHWDISVDVRDRRVPRL